MADGAKLARSRKIRFMLVNNAILVEIEFLQIRLIFIFPDAAISEVFFRF
jgi:hypothetical protein